MLDYKKIAEKWQEKWKKERIYEPEINKKKKNFYIQVAYPYPSGAMHIGHARTYTVTDIVSRYFRMKGYNSLMPMGWHVSGTPVIASVELLKKGDEKTIKKMTENFKIPRKDIEEMKTPEGFVNYFVEKAETGYKEGFKRLGLGIDWRRELKTMDPQYNKFIQWQYRKLYEEEYIIKKKYPTRYCPNDKNAVGDHDLVEGQGVGIQEFTALKFKYKDMFIVAATLRPETVFGQTNLWIDPDIEYAIVEISDSHNNGKKSAKEKWVLSREAVEKLSYQNKEVEVIGKIKGKELIGEYAKAPGIEKEIIILPSKFCDPNIGTGIVTSVPGHAPYDYIALVELQNNEKEMKKYGLNPEEIKNIEIIPMIKTEKYGDKNAGKIVIEKLGIKDQEDPKLEQAKKIVYKEEYHTGRMAVNTGKYAGMPVAKAKEAVKKELIGNGEADKFYELDGKAVCRCGTNILVSVLDDQWFVKYSDEKWKKEASETLKAMKIVPEYFNTQYEHVFDWLEDKPCTRSKGLGTKFPWDESKIIEPLGDSTIYMAYFTISHLIKGIEAEKINDEVFDFIFLREGNSKKIAEKTGIEKNLLEKMQMEFDYWYPLAFNTSALELIPNHMSFSIFHHTAIFPKKKRQLGTLNLGMLIINGEKMSSSKGNVKLVNDMTDDIGADMVRFFLMNSVEPWLEMDWRDQEVRQGLKSINNLIEKFFDKADLLKNKNMKEMEVKEMSQAGKWVLSAWNDKLKNATDSMDAFEIRKALQELTFKLINDLKWFERRFSGSEEESNYIYGKIIREWCLALTPVMPHTCEELWEKLNNWKGFAVMQEWPEAGKADENALKGEEYIKGVLEDIENIKGIAGKEKLEKVILYVSPEWKKKALGKVIKACREKPDMKKAIEALMKDKEIKKHGKEVPAFAKTALKRINEFREKEMIEEFSILKEENAFLERELNANVEIEKASETKNDPAGKARNAFPLKPAIYLK